MLIKKEILIDFEHCNIISNNNIEMISVNIKKGHGRRLNIVGVYRPLKGNWTEALKIIENTTKDIKTTLKGEVSILGDLNIDVLQKDKPAHMINTNCNNLGLKQLITDPSRETNKSSTCIDLILTNLEWIKVVGVVDSNISDHYPIFLTRKKERLSNDRTEVTS